jgi:penicillin-binding protein 2
MFQRNELELLNSRVTVILGLVLLAFGVLTFGFWNHQIARSPYYRQLAERNRLRDIPLPAPRGQIYDRENRIIADSRPSFDLILTRENSDRSVEESIDLLDSGIELSAEELLSRIEPYLDQPEYEPILLAEDLSLEETAFVEARKYELSEISLVLSPRRRYEGQEVAAHLIGYVGQITQSQLDSGEFGESEVGDVVGQSGLERQYDRLLQGEAGIRRVIVNNFGREVGLLGEARPVPGNDLVTTLDLDLQLAAEEALGDRTGVAVAMIPRTGEVLALVSRPAFDPTLFAQGIRQNEWNMLLSDPRKPLQNRAIQNRYSPGSIFKIFMAAAGLEEQEIGFEEAVFCPGHSVFYGNRFDCWNAGGHGTMDVHHALVHSCNVFFYNVGDRLGIERISQYAGMMGLGRKTGIDLPGEAAGLIPSEEWKQSTSDTRWFPGETISVSIGQGPVSVTPLQLTWAVGGLVVGGKLVQPHLADPEVVRPLGFEVSSLREEKYGLGEDTLNTVRQALWGAVNELGTATRARVRGFEVGGKTGTAQVVAKDVDSSRADLKDHAWFVGFAPYDDPEIVVGVFVENGGGGGAAAAPVAQAIMQVYFDKKGGLFIQGKIGEVAELSAETLSAR